MGSDKCLVCSLHSPKGELPWASSIRAPGFPFHNHQRYICNGHCHTHQLFRSMAPLHLLKIRATSVVTGPWFCMSPPLMEHTGESGASCDHCLPSSYNETHMFASLDQLMSPRKQCEAPLSPLQEELLNQVQTLDALEECFLYSRIDRSSHRSGRAKIGSANCFGGGSVLVSRNPQTPIGVFEKPFAVYR